MNAEDLINYLKTVSNAAPNTPLLYYHIPMFTTVNSKYIKLILLSYITKLKITELSKKKYCFIVHMGNFLETIGEKVPTFAGIKFTSNNLEEGALALKADNGRFAVFLGNDQVNYSKQEIFCNKFFNTGKYWNNNEQNLF